MTDETIHLNPCPFCGGPAFVESDRPFVYIGPKSYRPRCRICNVVIDEWSDDYEQAAEAWNYRVAYQLMGKQLLATLEQLIERISALEAKVK